VTGVWTTNIHDCLHGKVWPIMGAGYHLTHHTMYNVNYGHYLVYMDWMFGTLITPEEYEDRLEATRETLAARKVPAADEPKGKAIKAA